jgi:hypothetical protein
VGKRAKPCRQISEEGPPRARRLVQARRWAPLRGLLSAARPPHHSRRPARCSTSHGCLLHSRSRTRPMAPLTARALGRCMVVAAPLASRARPAHQHAARAFQVWACRWAAQHRVQAHPTLPVASPLYIHWNGLVQARRQFSAPSTPWSLLPNTDLGREAVVDVRRGDAVRSPRWPAVQCEATRASVMVAVCVRVRLSLSLSHHLARSFPHFPTCTLSL